MSIRIINKHKGAANATLSHERSFCVDRSSPLGNPFFLKTEADRDAVCDAYEDYFYRMIAENVNKPFMLELSNIIATASCCDIVLRCWCAPKRCHAETIRNYIYTILAANDKPRGYYWAQRKPELYKQTLDKLDTYGITIKELPKEIDN